MGVLWPLCLQQQDGCCLQHEDSSNLFLGMTESIQQHSWHRLPAANTCGVEARLSNPLTNRIARNERISLLLTVNAWLLFGPAYFVVLVYNRSTISSSIKSSNIAAGDHSLWRNAGFSADHWYCEAALGDKSHLDHFLACCCCCCVLLLLAVDFTLFSRISLSFESLSSVATSTLLVHAGYQQQYSCHAGMKKYYSKL